jgi:hypothetical protein
MYMLSKKALTYLQKNNYSFEEIQWIKLWLEQAKRWETISQKEMLDFINTELFSKYSVNA